MSVQELLIIVFQCRKILSSIQQTQKNKSLITRIDQQLFFYRKNKDQKPDTNQKLNLLKPERRSSKKNIFNQTISLKKQESILQRQFFCHSPSQFLQFNSQKSQDSSVQQSIVSPISLNSIRASQSNQQTIFQKKLYLNQNAEGKNYTKYEKCASINKQVMNQEINSKNTLQIEDFFMIDFNFDSNQYEILPKKQNFYDKCSFPTSYIQFKGHLNKPSYDLQDLRNLKSKSNQYKNQIGMFPFNQVSAGSSNISSQLSDTQRYSTQVQLSQNSKVMTFLSASKQIFLQQLYQMRQVIVHLMTCSASFHIQQIKLTSSRTNLYKSTANPSYKNRKLQHIVIPSFLQIRKEHNFQKCNKYTHIIRSTQCVGYGMKYYQCDRFYVFVEKQRKFVDIKNVVNGLIKKAFEMRVHADGQVDNVQYANIRKYAQQISLIPKNKLFTFMAKPQNGTSFKNNIFQNKSPCVSDPLSQVYSYCQTATKFKFSLQIPPNSETKSFNFLLILIYFVIFQYKIIFLATKGYESLISQVINALIHMLGHLRYVYPIILAVLTNHHIQFTNSPVPGFFALWGSDQRYKKAIHSMKRKLQEQAFQNSTSSSKSSNMSNSNSSSTIVIDMNKHEFVQHQFTHQELYIIENLHSFVKSKNKKQNLIETVKNFINLMLMTQQKSENHLDKWVNILEQRLKMTQMYEEYMKYQQSLQK